MMSVLQLFKKEKALDIAHIGLSVIIPTIGRDSINRTMESIQAQQLQNNDEIWVIGDTLDGPLPHVEAYINSLGEPFRYLGFTGPVHHYGNPQRNHGITLAREGNYLVWMDDTDIFTENAFFNIRKAIAKTGKPQPHIFKFIFTNGTVLWKNRKIKIDRIGGHQFVTPNLPGLVGRWSIDRYQADYDFIMNTLQYWPHYKPIFHTDIIADCRPVNGNNAG